MLSFNLLSDHFGFSGFFSGVDLASGEPEPISSIKGIMLGILVSNFFEIPFVTFEIVALDSFSYTGTRTLRDSSFPLDEILGNARERESLILHFSSTCSRATTLRPGSN